MSRDGSHASITREVGTLSDPDTPFAVVDVTKVRANIERLRSRLTDLGVTLRPHMKTAKALEIGRMLFDGNTGPITVSTLAEAEAFGAAGFSNITYAVGIDPRKLLRVRALHDRGVTVTVLLDSMEQARAVTDAARAAGGPIPTLVEIDCDGHRGGVGPRSAELLQLGTELSDTGCLHGVLVHAGESYFASTTESLVAAAENERTVAVEAAETLRAAGLSAPTVSVGSTPTAHAATDLTGVTEVRAGNFVFFDLVMAGLGVCDLDDLALSIVVTVIGHQVDRDWIITDGGWMATSRDRGTAVQPRDQGYGLICDIDGNHIAELIMINASQEHGILAIRPGVNRALPDLPVGTRLRVLPNHACATAAQHARYHVIAAGSGTYRSPEVIGRWSRVQGW